MRLNMLYVNLIYNSPEVVKCYENYSSYIEALGGLIIGFTQLFFLYGLV